MSDPLDITCPNCGKVLKVPAQYEGKRIKCRDCGEAFVAKAPKAKAPAKGAKPAAKPDGKTVKAAPPPPPAAPKGGFDDDDEDEKNPKAIGVIYEDDSARCPHCAQVLDPPDAVVCKNCGYNNKTRVKADSKKVWAPDAMDWVHHLAPGVIALLIVIGLIVLDIFCLLNMESWLEGSDLQDDTADPVTGKKKFFVRPGAFTALIMAISAIIIIPATAFAWKRLVRDHRPFEQVKK
jgi:DNA-directed RNA polymerase subunit M/transcription elongation factor TFIIS